MITWDTPIPKGGTFMPEAKNRTWVVIRFPLRPSPVVRSPLLTSARVG
jgi:hypothetical protein